MFLFFERDELPYCWEMLGLRWTYNRRGATVGHRAAVRGLRWLLQYTEVHVAQPAAGREQHTHKDCLWSWNILKNTHSEFDVGEKW